MMGNFNHIIISHALAKYSDETIAIVFTEQKHYTRMLE